MIKTYSQFITEGLGKVDAYRYVIIAAAKNLEQYRDDREYTNFRIDDGTCYLNISGKTDEPLSSCNDDITFMIMPPNFNPNLMVSLESGSFRKNTPITKFQVINDAKMVEATKSLYNDIKNEADSDFNTIIVTIGY